MQQNGLPCDTDVLLSFQGVGPSALTSLLGIACNQPRISVDIHVHRVTNRWGYVHTPKTMVAREAKLPCWLRQPAADAIWPEAGWANSFNHLSGAGKLSSNRRGCCRGCSYPKFHRSELHQSGFAEGESA